MVLCKEDPVLLWALRNSLEAIRHVSRLYRRRKRQSLRNIVGSSASTHGTQSLDKFRFPNPAHGQYIKFLNLIYHHVRQSRAGSTMTAGGTGDDSFKAETYIMVDRRFWWLIRSPGFLMSEKTAVFTRFSSSIMAELSLNEEWMTTWTLYSHMTIFWIVKQNWDVTKAARGWFEFHFSLHTIW